MQPPKYERNKDFTEDFGIETDHSSLNAELDAASNSINDIRTNLAILQADDGKLRPEVVTVDSITQALRQSLVDEVEADAIAMLAQANTASSTSITQAGLAADAAASAGASAATATQKAIDAAASASQATAATIFNQGGAGAIARAVQDKLRESVSVIDFGAVGDGVTDDAAKIQAAVNSLGVAGGKVLLPNGLRCLIESTLNIPDNVLLEGGKPVHGKTFGVASSVPLWGSTLIIAPTATIKLNNSSGLRKLVLLSKSMTFNLTTAQIAAQWTGTAITLADNTADHLVDDCLIIGFKYGIANTVTSPRIDRTRIERVALDCINGIYLRNVYDVPYIRQVHGYPFATLGAVPEANNAHLKRTGTFINLNSINDYTKVTDCFSFGWAVGYSVTGPGGGGMTFTGCGADHPPGASDGSIGFNFSGGVYEPRMIGCQVSAKDNGVIFSSSDVSNGRLLMSGCNLWENVFQGVVQTSGKLLAADTIIRSAVAGSNGVYVTNGAQKARLLGGSINVANIGIKTDSVTTPVIHKDVDFESTPTQLNNPYKPTVASANPLPLDGLNSFFEVTGVNNFNTIQPVSAYAGKCITLKFTGALYASNGGNMHLQSDFLTSPNDTLTLVSDGVSWYEIPRSANV